MPNRSSPPALPRLLLGFVAFGLLACQTPGSTRIVGPDGSAMAHVHCGSDQGTCFRLAGELCPNGYEMRPVLSHSDGNFLVRCRGAAAVAAAPVCPTPATLALPTNSASSNGGALASHSAPNQGWPPATEPWPAAYPWPPPEASESTAPIVPAKPGKEPWDPGF